MEKSILHTLCYFDIAHFPLTKEELWRFLWSPVSVSRSEYDRAIATGLVPEKFGYYFLPGQEVSVEARRAALVPTEQKLKKARKAARLLHIVPFLRAVFVCNSVGREVAATESDIDFFIVTESNRLWIVRFFVNAILRLCGLRTYGKKQRDRICLSFFVDREHMDLSPWRIAPDDVHLAYWILQMVPVYDPGNLYQTFLVKNSWLKQYLPNAVSVSQSILPMPRLGLWKRVWERAWSGAYGDMIEKQAREIQKSLLSSSVKNKAGERDCGVVIQDGVLKLHEHDTRRSYRQAWLDTITTIAK